MMLCRGVALLLLKCDFEIAVESLVALYYTRSYASIHIIGERWSCFLKRVYKDFEKR